MSKNIILLNLYYLFRKAPVLFLIQNMYFIHIGYSVSELFWANSFGIGAYVVFDYLGSWFADHKGKRLSLEIGLYFQMGYVLFAYFAQSQSLVYVYISFIFNGIARAFYGTADLVYDYEIIQNYSNSNYTQFRGNLRSFLNLGFFGFTLLGTYFLSLKEPNLILILSLFILISVIFILKSLPNDKVCPHEERRTIIDVVNFIKQNLGLFNIGVLFSVSYFAMEIGLFQLIAKNIGTDLILVGKMTSLMIFTGVLSAPFVKLGLSLKVKKKYLFGLLIIIKIFCLLLWFSKNVYIISFSFIIYTLTLTLFWAVYDELFFSKIDKKIRARVNSVRWGFAAIFAIIINQAGAWLVKYNKEFLILGMALIIISILLINLILLYKNRKKIE